MKELSPQAIAARREYQRRWRKKNPDKVREKNARYWEKRTAKREEAPNEQGSE